MKASDKKLKSDQDQDKQIKDLTDSLQRLQAEFDNYRKRTNEENAQISSRVKFGLLEEFLPVLDNLDLADKSTPDEIKNNSWVIGMRAVASQLETVFQNIGLTRLVSVGQQFDPGKHEAIEEVYSDKPIGEVVEEIATGYAYQDKIVRYAKVKISKGKELPSKENK
ncbi:nucleotide exchange factor GrpE [Candidatus Saccharibacteria bacterium]|nr:nucleotide exchange factor GrpE [Candidatus Saccharibacteria bacterium]MCB9834546.1 nucleotide exchange factor GrpE [Candidatus Nomurabacteria bacterium]